ncbi:hypothetical protein EDF35_1916 [Rathayibacter sp. PhB151]|uniref:hypothetical protein n=1 Tax=Rathayibacter sp. PhB151 TaxID=2485189 RepID=UPI001062FA06|nr:hypothetical protein [Rathayibacter sp. PhB151]TDX78702.1 hypothetical protein EDF35_1916 [Rathayibacter sp. PhB151]
MLTEPITPDAVRALIARLERRGAPPLIARIGGQGPVPEQPDRVLFRDAAAALSASLPREDLDLDALEPFLVHVIRDDMRLTPAGRGGAVRTDPATPGRGALGQPGDNLVHDYDAAVQALLGRVRAAEAERDAARDEAGTAYAAGFRDGKAQR